MNKETKKFISGIFTALIIYTIWAILKTHYNYKWPTDLESIANIHYLASYFLFALLIINIILYKRDYTLWAGFFLFNFFFTIYLLYGNILIVKRIFL